MKKVFRIMAAVFLAGALFTACGSHQSCPAYGKVHKAPAGQRI